MSRIFLTGVRDLDFKILNELDDRSLVQTCRVNKVADEICNDQIFWLNRIMTKFPYLSLDMLNNYKGNRSWSQYYIDDLRTVTVNNATQKLLRAISDGRFDLVKVAVNKGADVNFDDGTPIMKASDRDDNLQFEIVKYLIESGADIHGQDDYAFRVFAYENNLPAVKYLVEHGANVHAEEDEALSEAARGGYLDMVKYLLEHGAFVDVLYYTPFNYNREIVDYLVGLGVDINRLQYI